MNKEVHELILFHDTEGIFQFSGMGIVEMLIDAQPRTFEELMAVSSMNRHPVIEAGTFDLNLGNKGNPDWITYPQDMNGH